MDEYLSNNFYNDFYHNINQTNLKLNIFQYLPHIILNFHIYTHNLNSIHSFI